MLRRPIDMRQGNLYTSAPALFRLTIPGMIHENSTQLLPGDGKEMRAILPLHRLGFEQTQKHLVHQRRRLQSMVRTLTAHMISGQTSQFLINRGDQFVGSLLVPFAPAGQKRSNSFPIFRHQCATDYQSLGRPEQSPDRQGGEACQ